HELPRSCYLRAWVAEGNSQRVRSSDTSAGETDFRCSRATGVRRISPNDPKIIVREHREKSKTLIKNFCVIQRAIFNWKFFKKKILNILYERVRAMKLVQSRHSLRDQSLPEVRHRMLENIISNLF